MSNVTLKVNGKSHTLDIDPATPLLYILRNDLDLRGPRFGCGLGQCGACTVIINGTATRSCVTPVSNVRAEVTTLEGIGKDGALHPIQQAWIDEQVPQCGFCQNGQIMTAKALLDKNKNPSDAEIREGMARTLCRCMTYYRIQAAVKRAAKVIA
jgi:aerobic-type carbon monoxide dehydrogenase small subunit (CoxS/CutS family)